MNAPAGELVTVVSIKAGTECFVTQEGAAGTVRSGDCFGNVVAGSYVVEAPLHATPPPLPWSLTAPNKGSDDSKDSDFEILVSAGIASTTVFAFPTDGVIDDIDAGYGNFND